MKAQGRLLCVSTVAAYFHCRCSLIFLSSGCDSCRWGKPATRRRYEEWSRTPAEPWCRKATITITNDGTGISTTAHTDDNGLYILTGLRPAVYTIRAEAAGFRASEQKNVVLQVDQQTTIDFTLHPLGVITTVEVTEAAPLLDTESAAIGTDVTNEYVRDIPLYGRNPFALVFLAGGVTETTGSGSRLSRRYQLCLQRPA